MDLFTYHTLMMGHTKLGRHQKVLALYNEALESSAKVRVCVRLWFLVCLFCCVVCLMSRCVVFYHVLLFCVVLCNVALCNVVLCFVMLCCVALCFNVP